MLEAYLVLAEALVDVDFRHDADKDRLIESALGLGQQYAAQRRIGSPEAVSTVLFGNAIRLAANRDLMVGSEDVKRLDERKGLAEEIRAALDLIDTVAQTS
jgi:glycerol-3-phosphate O-acyltransferase